MSDQRSQQHRLQKKQEKRRKKAKKEVNKLKQRLANPPIKSGPAKQKYGVQTFSRALWQQSGITHTAAPANRVFERTEQKPKIGFDKQAWQPD